MWERRRAEALEHGYSAPASKVYEVVIDELKALDGETDARFVNTEEAAKIAGCAPKTVAKWAKEGRLSGAVKTSQKDGKKTGEWRIPAASVYALRVGKAADPLGPRLWRVNDG